MSDETSRAVQPRAWRLGIGGRLRAALPAWRTVLAGMLVWAAVMAASAWLTLTFYAWETEGRIAEVVTLFGLGGALSFPVGLYLARLVALGRSSETAFTAAFLAFSLATIGLTAVLYALEYRAYYAEWHSDPLTVRWFFEFVFTTLAAFYQFAVLGVRMYLPVGFIALVLASLWFVRQPR